MKQNTNNHLLVLGEPPFKRRNPNWRMAIVLASAISACSSLDDHYVPEDVPTPTQFYLSPTQQTAAHTAPTGENADSHHSDTQANNDKATVAKEANNTNPTEIEWWRHFRNRELNALVDRALANNPEIRVSLTRIVQSKARFEQAAAGKLPTLSGPMTIARQSRLAYASLPTASIRADWKLDIWGEQSALADSASFQLERSIYEFDNVKRNMIAALLNAYIEYLSLNDRIRIARDTEYILHSTLENMEKRFQVGEVTLPELEQQKAAIFSARASIPTLEQQRTEALHSIATIIGSVPGDVKLSDQGIDALKAPDIAPGIPSSLLLQRPDIRAAEAQLKSANANIQVARAKMLPSLDLYAERGYRGTAIDALFLPQALFLDLVARFTFNIFDGGRRKSEVEFSQAAKEEMVEGYARTVRQAVKEVESALNTIQMSQQRISAHQNAAEAAKRAWEINTKLYIAGHSDYQTLLDNQRSYNRYLEDYQRSRMDLFKGHISLLQSLGNAPSYTTPVPDEDFPFIANRQEENHDQDTWRVELSGLYPQSAINAVWRDLKYRFPDLMESKVVLPRLEGQVVEGVDSAKSWYRLYLAEFEDISKAQSLCLTLNTHQQRCKVVSSQSNEPVAFKKDDDNDNEDHES